jgi:hypothetical protein
MRLALAAIMIFILLSGCVVQEGPKQQICTDGTPAGSCSASKPYFCNASLGLVENASACGCPEGYGAAGSSCEKPKLCSDGTVGGECSGAKPLFCMDGILVGNATLCGCQDNYHVEGSRCTENAKCQDGTYDGRCSPAKPFYCSNGTFVENAGICGCPEDYLAKGESCEKIIRCSDGTISGGCTANKPLYCLNGTFVSRSSICGCLEEQVEQGEGCVSIYETGEKEGIFGYVLRGDKKTITIPVYYGLDSYQANISRYYYCNPECPSDIELEMKYIDEPKQRDKLLGLVDRISSMASTNDDRARMAISLVQNIPYDTGKLDVLNATGRYPYEVLYDDLGICEEKSHLLAFLLRELGYGTALLKYDAEDHMAVGIKCADDYAYRGTGYCFVETTVPSIITFSEANYSIAGRLLSAPEVLKVSDGAEFNAAEEYSDANEWERIGTVADESPGRRIPVDLYNEWQDLVQKYGIQVENG